MVMQIGAVRRAMKAGVGVTPTAGAETETAAEVVAAMRLVVVIAAAAEGAVERTMEAAAGEGGAVVVETVVVIVAIVVIAIAAVGTTVTAIAVALVAVVVVVGAEGRMRGGTGAAAGAVEAMTPRATEPGAAVGLSPGQGLAVLAVVMPGIAERERARRKARAASTAGRPSESAVTAPRVPAVEGV
jgi:hypothetical protein